jgi:hypothetical protein
MGSAATGEGTDGLQAAEAVKLVKRGVVHAQTATHCEQTSKATARSRFDVGNVKVAVNMDNGVRTRKT